MIRDQILLDDEMFDGDVVPEWERSFGIRFSNGDFAHATTVGTVWAIVERHLIAGVGENPSGMNVACATQRTFYCLRRALVARGLARAEVTPKSQLRTLLPWRKRRRAWRTLQQTSGLPLPELRMPAMLFVAIWAVTTALCWATAPGWGTALVAGLAVALVTSQFTWLQWECAATTLRELTTQMVTANYRTLSHPYVRNNLGEMREIVLNGIAKCGAEPVEINYKELRDGTRLVW